MKRYMNFNTLLHDARLVERMQKKSTTYFPCWNKPTYNWNSGSGCMALTSASENARGNGIIGGFSGRQGSYSNPVATKPAR